MLPFVVRIERDAPPTRTDALEAATRGVLLMLTDGRADWHDAVTCLGRAAHPQGGAPGPRRRMATRARPRRPQRLSGNGAAARLPADPGRRLATRSGPAAGGRYTAVRSGCAAAGRPAHPAGAAVSPVRDDGRQGDGAGGPRRAAGLARLVGRGSRRPGGPAASSSPCAHGHLGNGRPRSSRAHRSSTTQDSPRSKPTRRPRSPSCHGWPGDPRATGPAPSCRAEPSAERRRPSRTGVLPDPGRRRPSPRRGPGREPAR